jgi:hypothetical protein
VRDDESNLFTLDHFLDDAEHWYLPLILCKVKPYTRVNKHPEHESSLHVNEIAEEIVLDYTARLLLARASSVVLGPRGTTSGSVPF